MPSSMLITGLLRERARLQPDGLALRVDGGADLRFGDWQRRVDGVAHGLLAAGLRPGDRVALVFGGTAWAEYAIGYLAVLNAGSTAVHLSEGMAAAELRRRIAETETILVLHRSGAVLPPALGLPQFTLSQLDTGERTPVPVSVPDTAIADILYTSGTTGNAKAFTNPHGNLVFGRGPEGLRQFGTAAPMLAPMPLGSTSSATTAGVIAITSPMPVVISSATDVERMGELIGAEGVGFVMLTPRIAQRMIAARLDERHDLKSVTRLASASAPMPPALSYRLLEMFPAAQLSSAYSQSEAVPAVITNTFDPARPTTLGRPAPGTEAKVADPEGRPLQPGRRGEIWLRSAAPKRLYLDEARNAVTHLDGWTRTGDLGHQDEEGLFYLFDRREDVIEVAGQQLSSIEIEAELYEYPAVLAAAVVGVPDGDQGVAVTAYLVLQDPERLAELRAFAASRLRPPALPTRWEAVEELPRGITGKPLKRVLRAGEGRLSGRLSGADRAAGSRAGSAAAGA